MKAACKILTDLPGVMPGWGCCSCLRYNGLQRKECKFCGHVCCNPDKPLPAKLGLCNECGVPVGARHVGHLDGAVFGGGVQTKFRLDEAFGNKTTDK